MLKDFFKQELECYLQESDLDKIGKEIIECCMKDGSIDTLNPTRISIDMNSAFALVRRHKLHRSLSAHLYSGFW